MADSDYRQENDDDFIAKKKEEMMREYTRRQDRLSPEMVRRDALVLELYPQILDFLTEKTDFLPEAPVEEPKLMQSINKAVREAVEDYIALLARALNRANARRGKDLPTFIPEGFVKDLEALQVRLDMIQEKYNFFYPVPDVTGYDFSGVAGHVGRPTIKSDPFTENIRPILLSMREEVSVWTNRAPKTKTRR